MPLEGESLHNCQDTLQIVQKAREDLSDIPLVNADMTLYTDGSSYMANKKRYTGAAVVTQTDFMVFSIVTEH